MFAVVTLITASDARSIRGSATVSTATSNAALYTTAFTKFSLAVSRSGRCEAAALPDPARTIHHVPPASGELAWWLRTSGI
jgi:hypothetical protein